MSTEQDKTIKDVLPVRNIDASIDLNDARQKAIDEIKAEQRAASLKRRASYIKRKNLRADRDEDNIELKQVINASVDNSIAKNRVSEDVIVVEKGGARLTGTTRPEIAELMRRLNINLNVHLTKTDTMNLLATLLTCSEQQLNALLKNKKVPVAIKIVTKRLIEDSKVGNMESIEAIWDRVFGKAGMTLQPLGDSVDDGGLIPNTPVSRETYMVMREVYMGTKR